MSDERFLKIAFANSDAKPEPQCFKCGEILSWPSVFLKMFCSFLVIVCFLVIYFGRWSLYFNNQTWSLGYKRLRTSVLNNFWAWFQTSESLHPCLICSVNTEDFFYTTQLTSSGGTCQLTELKNNNTVENSICVIYLLSFWRLSETDSCQCHVCSINIVPAVF